MALCDSALIHTPPPTLNPHPITHTQDFMAYLCYMKKIIHNILIVGFGLTIGLVFFNTFYQHPVIWHVVNILYILIPILFTCTIMRSAQGGYIIAALLWIPAFVVAYMASQGLLTVDHNIWQITNMYQLIIYSYLIGTCISIPFLAK